MTSIVNYFSYLFVRSLLLILHYSPEKLANAISRFCLNLLILFVPRFKSVGLRNLEIIFPEKSFDERKQILQKSFGVLARNLLTFSKLENYSKADLEQMFDFREPLEVINSVRKRNPERGIIFPTLHYGCFELFIQAHSRVSGKNISAVTREFGITNLDRWWNSKRQMFGNRVLPRKGAFREIVKVLTAGKDIALLFDQNVKRNHAIFVNFFGMKAATTKTISLAAIKTGAPVILIASAEISPGKHKVYAKEIPLPKLSSRTEIVEQHSELLHRFVEEIIREHPEQWFWIHRRYKTRPLGESETIYANQK